MENKRVSLVHLWPTFLNPNSSYWNQSNFSQDQYLEFIAQKDMKPGEFDDPEVEQLISKGWYYMLYGPTRDIWFGMRIQL